MREGKKAAPLLLTLTDGPGFLSGNEVNKGHRDQTRQALVWFV